MLKLKKKYLVTKALWGVLYLISGITKVIQINEMNELLGTVMNILTWSVFVCVMGINLYFRNRKIEIEDELAQKNMLKAKALIYEFIFVCALVYLLFGSSFNMNIGIIFLILGLFQILEYVFFEHYENRGVDGVGSI